MSRVNSFSLTLRTILMAMVGLLVAGCAQGPKWVRSDWREYNDSVVDVANQELLLNIVRLRYNDYPGVLKIGSLTSQRNWSVNGNLGGALVEGSSDNLSAGIGGIRSERPTVSFLPGGEASVTATLTPLSLESLYLASYLEWPASTFMPILVKSINSVENAPQGGSPLPTKPPRYAEFYQLAQCLKELQDRDLVEVGRVEKLEKLSDRIQLSTLTAAETREADESGYVYQQTDRQNEIMLSQRKQVPVLRFSRDAVNTEEFSTIADLLDLDRNQLVFELEPAFGGTLTERDEHQKSLRVGLRSLLEMLFLVSKGVEVPQQHLACNLAPSDEFQTDWRPVLGGFRVRVCDEKPTCAAVAVCYRGCWFYVSDTDQESKSAFFFIKLIHDTQIQGGGAENLPVLTLPL